MAHHHSLDSLAQAILDHLVASPDLVQELVAESGMRPEDLRALAGGSTTDFATALVDFISATDDRLGGFAAASGWLPADVARLREALAAGAAD